MFQVVGHLADALVQQLELGRGRCVVADERREADQVEQPGRLGGGIGSAGDGRSLLVIRLGLFVDKETPHPAEEAVHAFDALGVPRLGVLQRSHEHLIQPERVGTIFHQHVIWVDHVAAGFGHFLAVFTEDQALVDQLEEGLCSRNLSQVEQHLVPETGVQQMQHGVLGTAHVEVYSGRLAAGFHPVVLNLATHEALSILRIEVAQVIPARTRPLRHGVGLANGAVRQVQPVLSAGQRRLSVGRRLVVLERRRHQRQGRLGQCLVVQNAIGVLAPKDRERFAPVALTAEEPVPQLEVHRLLAEPLRLQPDGDLPLGLRGG